MPAQAWLGLLPPSLRQAQDTPQIPPSPPPEAPHEGKDRIGSRIARNVGWLAGARGFTGLLSIFYLAFASRALGPRDFGTFALVLTYGQLVANLVQFQSWKGVIRFGAIHLRKERPARLARLFGFTATLDAFGIVVGSIVAAVGVPLVSNILHWSADQQVLASIFAVALLFGTGGTPSGILRLFGRFDLLAFTEGIGPTIRLFGAMAAWLTDSGIAVFLAIWAGAAIAQSVGQWLATLILHQTKLTFGIRAFRIAIGENHRLWRFMILTNVSSSMSLFWMQLGTLAVGAVAGPVQAGGFRMAHRLSKGIANPIELVTRALYPEFARLVADNNFRILGRLLIRITCVASALAAVTVGIVAVGGKWILGSIAGPQFEFAYLFLTLLSVSTAIDLASFALEPYHIAQGRAGRILRIRLIGAVAYLGILALLLPRIGARGAAIAAICASAVMFGQLILSTWQILRGKV